MELFTPPREFDGYKLVKLIGRGGMGAVYLAMDTQLDRPVAVKFILTDDDDPSARRRFMVEARAAARLQHPNVVSIYRVGETNRMPYIVSELIRGKALDEIDLPVTYALALKLGIGIARGLAAAHRRGVIHRDIKPANAVLSEDGEVKLLDFGIAKLVPYLNDPTVLSVAPKSPAPIRSASQKTLPLDTGGKVVDETRPVDMEWAHAAAADLRGTISTSDNEILGTPQFMAPEVWNGEPSDFQSDIYSFGMLLYTLCAGRPAHTSDNLLALRSKIIECDAPSLVEVAPHVDKRFAAIVDRCLSRDRALRFSSISEVKAALDRLESKGRMTEAFTQNPYRGLFAFEAEHKDFFFGRDVEIRSILDRMETEPFVLAAGDSGVGKSSLLRAGVLPALAQQSDKKWMTVCLVPSRRPLQAFSAALSPFLDESEPSTAEAIAKDPSSVARRLRARAKEENLRLALFVDQFEEFATVSDKEEAEHVLSLLSHLFMPCLDIRVLAAARSDFLGRLAVLPKLEAEIPRALVFINPMTEDGVREAVTGPAEMTGVTFESQALVDELVSSCATDGGGLPLLQFTLAELWRLRDEDRQIICKSALDELGGVSGALSRHADNVLSQMSPSVLSAAEAVLLDLVTADGTRARKTGDELCGNLGYGKAALDALVRGRLVTAKAGGEADDATYEIAHEVLIREWSTLKGWLYNNADRRMVLSRLAVAAKEWNRLGRSKQALWGDKQLGETQKLSVATLPPLERSFLLKSKRGILFRKMRLAALVSALPIAALLIWSGLKFKADSDLNYKADLLVDKAALSFEKAQEKERTAKIRWNEAVSKFDTMNPDGGEKILALFNNERQAAVALYQKASEDLESALLLVPSRGDIREKFAALLFERALLAESARAFREKDEYLKRLSIYDTDGDSKRRWDAPGSVVFNISPDEARIVLFRYEKQDDQRLKETPVKMPVKSGQTLELAQGSYIAVIERSGFVQVRYPFVVHRNETISIPIVLLSASSVPEGIVYIPPGRFEFGSAAEDNLRRDFFHAAPLHEVETEGFFIARRETTFREWFRYLDSLPKGERESRLPRVDKGGFQGALSIKNETDGTRSLSFQPSGVMLAAREGEKIRYEGRTRFRDQNWLDFPVSGISVEDAEKYTAWLRDSGTLKGARLCTDMEWERAARGADEREYPSGDLLYPEDANFDSSYGKTAETMGPDEVGSHPASDSPFGLSDMAGNVFEWTLSSVRENEIAARGGSFLFGPNTARVTEREITEPSFRDVSVGMRVCADTQP